MEKYSLIDTHLNNVFNALDEENIEPWSAVEGAAPQDIQQVKTRYPACPTELLELLQRVDGTYWRDYGDVTVSVPMLASDVGDDFGYYLLSCRQIIDECGEDWSIADVYGDWLSNPDIIKVDSQIDIRLPISERLCFAHCINNGGTSRLYIDFNPINGGRPGQIIRYLHDPDSYIVLAPSFAEYLNTLVKRSYEFVSIY
ncbi:SMI1/KNR4 family protein [Affinibrenneria salicis]|uniref:SMI1/KNR4 family protein n=2 Tax=Affinibrenneria salicis TaxID=2590031 RepID=A0A5J5G8K8_9GAMM|nr:SMI1/KNR4 family protein [Affinibrenneria salicis]KAA9003313.1 SMI1/KNR4 family protein [Affinibrenneria salicis]